jgi:7,8-dihydropterin-6-yl-methyl-4-(beta-D-ribofuranosyl)aminobenzene 5'-phosphate synthase
MAQQPSSILTETEVDNLYKALERDSSLVEMMDIIGKDPLVIYEEYKRAVQRSDSVWEHDQANLVPFENLGVTENLEILPLIDWFTVDETLTGEAGVSYLVRTDQATILFDLGLNAQLEDPSPLLRNMDELGISLDEIDMIVISHNHGDHTGGMKWSRQQTFSFSGHQLELGDIPVYTPEKMSYPGLDPIYAPKPLKLCEGVGTTGLIPGPLFFSDIDEQAIMVNVKGKGIVAISGCGHQTMEKLVKRIQLLAEEPMYGILGGFHLPISVGRNIHKYYQYLVTGHLPWDPLTRQDIEKHVSLLKKAGVKIVGISPHDSCDESIAIFREAYRDDYRNIIVGRKISL